jgi:uncharacterized protein
LPERSHARPRRWGLGDVAVGLIPAALGAIALLGDDGDADGPVTLGALVVTQLFLWAFLVGVPVLATSRKGNGPVRDLGLRAERADVPTGLGAGLVTQVLLVPLLYWPILYLLDDDSSDVEREAERLFEGINGVGFVVLFLVVVVAAPIAEELFYRGLLLRSLEHRFGTGWAVIGSSVLFGLTHLQGIQLPALVLFGLVAAVLAVRSGRLGPAIFAHVGFNAWTFFVLLNRVA